MDDLVGGVIDAIFAAASSKKPAGGSADSASPRPVGSAAQPLGPIQAASNARGVPSRPAQTAHDKEEARAAARMSGPLGGLFEDGNSLVRAVVAAELLGPPIALRENQLWQIRRPNERST